MKLRMKLSKLVTLLVLLFLAFAPLWDWPQDMRYRNQALRALAEGGLGEVILDDHEPKLFKYLDGSAIKIWVEAGNVEAHPNTGEMPSDMGYSGSKTLCVAIKDSDYGKSVGHDRNHDKYGLTLKLQVDYLYDSQRLKVTSTHAWGEVAWAYQQIYDYSRTSLTQSKDAAVVAGHYNIKYEYMQGGTRYTLTPTLKMQLTSSGTSVVVGWAGN